MDEHLPTLDAAGLTDRGRKRERNEDAFKLLMPPRRDPQEPHGALFVVADGMGGMGGGDVASQTAIEEIFRTYYAPESEDAPFNRLRAALEAANVAVRKQAQQMNVARIGSTAAGMLLTPDGEAVLFNVGDSRAYRVRGNFIELLTHDQSVVQAQIDAGQITEEEARQARNVNVTAFIGQPTPVAPVYRRTQTQPGDVFIICSDGLWDLVEPHELVKAVHNAPAEKAARSLVDMALERGAPDNVTVIVVRLGPPPRRSRLWAGIAAAAAVLLVALAVIAVLLIGGGDGDEDDSAQDAPGSPAAVASESGTTGVEAQAPGETLTPTDEPATSGPVVSIISATPSLTPTPSPTRPTDTPTPTDKPTLTVTPRPTRTSTATPTVSPSPTPTATRTPTRTATPTLTPSSTPTATGTASPTPTQAPSDTPEPTATLDPTVITYTPSATFTPSTTFTSTPLPSPTPTRSPADIRLALAEEAGVALLEDAALYLFAGASDGTPVLMETLLLPAGTEVRIVSTDQQPDSQNPGGVLREVVVLSGPQTLTSGWLSQDALAEAEPVDVYAVVKNEYEDGIIVRGGDSTSHRRAASLFPGDMVQVVGISDRGTGWYLVQLAGGQRGWIAPSLVDVYGSTTGLQSMAPPPLPMTFTPTPSSSDTAPAAVPPSPTALPSPAVE